MLVSLLRDRRAIPQLTEHSNFENRPQFSASPLQFPPQWPCIRKNRQHNPKLIYAKQTVLDTYSYSEII